MHVFFFFFQAEDGIRDLTVTGVQTCALPISKCARWNLAPLDDRLEQIEALARAANSGRVAAATEQVALIRWQSYDLVRVGKPRRMEFATWRYGERLKARRREQLKFVVPVTVAAVGLAVAV